MEYLEIHGSEVMNMLLTEWNTEDALAYAREEARNEGREEGRTVKSLEIARNLLAEGLPPEFVRKTTGLSAEDIGRL